MTDIIKNDVREKEKITAVKPLFSHLPERLFGLEELAENLWWSWNLGARMLFKTLDREAAPISRVLDKDGRQRIVKVPLTDPPIHVAVGKVAVGRVSLYLMDTDVAINDPWNRGITARLYIGDFEQRLRQEIVLGLGGAAVLNDLGIHPEKPEAGFNMTAFALKLSGCRNAVSKRHAEVSRKMWRSLWPAVPEDRVPIDHVTNGVHVPTWIEPKIKLLLDTYLGADWLDKHDDPAIWQRLDNVPDSELWQTHHWLKVKLIDAIRERTRLRWADGGGSSSVMLAGGAFLDPSVLTLGFARRFATYKRALLIFQDLDRLKKHFKDRWRPIQIIFAGKAHPADDPGKRLLQDLINLARNPQLGGRIAFVEDYGEQLAQYLVHGVDVWLNNPLPPFEACGTSGMKAALNGVPHLSVVDGWWGEGFNGKNGWAVDHHANSETPDGSDAEKIYRLLEDQIIPLYYQMSENGIPLEWVRLMKETIKSAAAAFSARRMVKQYIEKFYSNSIKNVLDD